MMVALALIAIDTQTPLLRPLRNWTDTATLPLYWLTNLSQRLDEWGGTAVKSRSEVDAENERLRMELLIHKGQLQRMADISAENLRLRDLLNAAQLITDKVLVAELIGVSPNPLQHLVILNRGTAHGVYLGQPLLDGDGLMGQVVEVSEHHSKALLITDSSHALPVQVARNGIRAIAEGTGNYDRLLLRHVAPAQDIQVGDRLVSSGLGGHFPAGYPVGQVARIERDPGQPFLAVTVAPAARLDRSRHLLLVFTEVDPLKPDAAQGGD
ncbi:MAG: rod shape-determining protein MreC [Porticoccaceae bacterium]